MLQRLLGNEVLPAGASQGGAGGGMWKSALRWQVLRSPVVLETEHAQTHSLGITGFLGGEGKNRRKRRWFSPTLAVDLGLLEMGGLNG